MSREKIMHSTRVRRTVRAALALTGGGCCLVAFAGGDIRGAGATFPAPLYAAWSAAYGQATGATVTYDAVGSGAGVDRIRRRAVNFGATDAPLPAPELAAAKLLQFPVVIGGVVPVINMRGIKPGQLRLSGDLLAGIYLARIRKWNEAPIAQLNPGLSLPNANITVVHRSDASGTSLLWTDFLARSSAAWQAQIGASSVPRWPSGIGGTGNEGVASFVQRTRFSIGYVEYTYAREHRLSDVALRNHSGQFVRAGRNSFRAAAEAVDWHALATMQQLPADLPGEESWPITGASFILVGSSPDDSASTRAVLQFFEWGLRQGAPIVGRLDYASLPQEALEGLPALWAPLLEQAEKLQGP